MGLRTRPILLLSWITGQGICDLRAWHWHGTRHNRVCLEVYSPSEFRIVRRQLPCPGVCLCSYRSAFKATFRPFFPTRRLNARCSKLTPSDPSIHNHPAERVARPKIPAWSEPGSRFDYHSTLAGAASPTGALSKKGVSAYSSTAAVATTSTSPLSYCSTGAGSSSPACSSWRAASAAAWAAAALAP